MKYLVYILLLNESIRLLNPYKFYFVLYYVIVAFHLAGAANHRYITLLRGSKAQWTSTAQSMWLRKNRASFISLRCIMSIAAKMNCAAYAGVGCQSNEYYSSRKYTRKRILLPCIWQLRYHRATVWLHVQWHSRTRAISSPTAPNIKFRELEPWYQR